MSAQLDAMRSFIGNAAMHRRAADRGSAVVIGSGKGGTGTSVVAALVALAAAAMGRRVLLVDADEHVGPQRYLLGIAPAPAIADLRAGIDPAALVVPVSATLSLVPGGPGVTGAPAVDAAERRALLRRVTALYPGHDLIVIDGGSRLDTVCACRDSAGGDGPARLLVVTSTEPVALAASYALVKAACERAVPHANGHANGRASGPVVADVVVNRHDEPTAARGFAQVAQAAREYLGATVRHAGTLPDDPSLALALRAGMPLQDAAAGSPAAIAAHAIAERLLNDLDGSTPSSYGPPSRLASPAGALR